MPEVTFTRQPADEMHKLRSYGESFLIDVSAWDKARCPVTLFHQEDGSNVTVSLHLTAAQARALGQELLHAADVAELAAKTTPGD